LLEPGLHHVGWHDPGLLPINSAVPENDEVRDAADAVRLCHEWLLIDINLEHDGAACHLFGNTRDFRRSQAAWSAPPSPEIHQDRDARRPDDLAEQVGIGVERRINRIERRFARAASNRFREVSGVYTIISTAGRASANDAGHISF
jgi:hypothetical protein